MSRKSRKPIEPLHDLFTVARQREILAESELARRLTCRVGISPHVAQVLIDLTALERGRAAR